MGISQLSGFTVSGAFLGKRDTAGQKYLTGTVANPSTSAFGSWSQITASTSADWYFVGLTAQAISGTSPAPSDGPLLVDLGIGGAGSETVIGQTAAPIGVNAPAFWIPFAAPILLSSGLRVAVRASLAANAEASPFTWRIYVAYVPASAVG